jgi:hypothetical protein
MSALIRVPATTRQGARTIFTEAMKLARLTITDRIEGACATT